jgi:membrane complex biogenesis BtpA family protein
MEKETQFNLIETEDFSKKILKQKLLIGMIHVRALPGTPLNKLSNKEIIDKALQEASIYKQLGVDAVIIENMFDTPYLKREVGPEIISMMAVLCKEVKEKYFPTSPVGVQILAGCNKASLAVAYSAGCDFIRAEGFVFSHIADEGFMDADCGELLRYRKQIGAEKIKIFTDIKKKHSSHAITSDLSIEDVSENAEFFLSDGIIVTGSSTGKSTDVDELKRVKKKCSIPVLIGSGLTAENLSEYIGLADGFIVGSYFKKDGKWNNEIDEERIVKFVDAWKKLTN